MSTVRRRTVVITNYEELGAYVDRKGGVATVAASRLRDIHGAQRLGSEIREAIKARLRRLGLGHNPTEIPDDHREPVRVYRLGSPVGDLIAAAEVVNSENDRALRQAAKSPEFVTRLKGLLEEFA